MQHRAKESRVYGVPLLRPQSLLCHSELCSREQAYRRLGQGGKHRPGTGTDPSCTTSFLPRAPVAGLSFNQSWQVWVPRRAFTYK